MAAMAGYSKVIMVGNLTRDPELKYLGSGTAVTNFSVAVNRTWKKDGVAEEGRAATPSPAATPRPSPAPRTSRSNHDDAKTARRRGVRPGPVRRTHQRQRPEGHPL